MSPVLTYKVLLSNIILSLWSNLAHFLILHVRKHMVKWAKWCPNLHNKFCRAIWSATWISQLQAYCLHHLVLLLLLSFLCMVFVSFWYVCLPRTSYLFWPCVLFWSLYINPMKTSDGKECLKKEKLMHTRRLLPLWLEQLIEISTISFFSWGVERWRIVYRTREPPWFFLPSRIEWYQ